VDLDCVNLALPEIAREVGAASASLASLAQRGGSPQESAAPLHPSPPTAGALVTPLAVRVAQFERENILAELERQHHHITNTAKALGLERSHLYKKCQALGISLRDREA
jgi:DNA-binding NtrC family response regulator